MRTIECSIGILAAVLVLDAGSVSGQTQPTGSPAKPVREVVSFVDGWPLPPELDQMVEGTELILLARGVRARSEALALYADGIEERVTTMDAKVLEVLHGEIAPDRHSAHDTISVSQYGGDVDKGDHILRTRESDVPFLAPGREYVLFLAWNNRADRWTVKWGADGIWQVDAGSVKSDGKSDLVKRLLPMRMDEAAGRIRQR